MKPQHQKNDLQLRKQKPYAVKSIVKQIADVDLTKRIVTGFYNTANYFDSDYDVIQKGAADKSMTERGPNSSAVCKIKHLLFHDWEKLPGKIITLDERTKRVGNANITGIYFETQMSNTSLGNDTVINYQEQVYDNHSIGFQFLDGEWIDSEADNWKQIVDTLINPQDAIDAGFMFLWKEIKLFEGSTVAFGANQLTPYLGVKDLKNKELLLLKVNDKMDLLYKQIAKGGQTDETLQSFEMQVLQLKQIINELFITPSMEDTRKKHARRQHKDDDDSIECPDCNTDNDYDDNDVQQDADGNDYITCSSCGESIMLCDNKQFSVKELLKIF